jgi:hypothetical protein
MRYLGGDFSTSFGTYIRGECAFFDDQSGVPVWGMIASIASIPAVHLGF